MNNIAIFIISGTRGSGKSLFINDVYDFLAIFEKNIRGFTSKGIFNDEGQKEFALKVLGSNEEIHLAARQEKKAYIQAGKFWFNPEAINRGNDLISKALEEKSKVLIIDEVGPVELDDQVWHNSLKKILKEYQGVLIFSCRKRMIERVMEKYRITDAFIEDVEETSPRKTGESVMSILLNLKNQL